MGLKSTNLQRSTEASPEGKATVLEENASDVSSSVSRSRAEKKARVITQTPPAPLASAADDVEAFYIAHRKLLLFVAARKFRIPECDAESLIQEVFLSYLQTNTPISDVRAWLVAATCNASRHYWRSQCKTEALPEDYHDRSDPRSLGLADEFALKMTIRQAVNYLPERCRETLRLHYFEGHSAVELARIFETTSRYAEKLIHTCLGRVREVYKKINTVSS